MNGRFRQERAALLRSLKVVSWSRTATPLGFRASGRRQGRAKAPRPCGRVSHLIFSITLSCHAYYASIGNGWAAPADTPAERAPSAQRRPPADSGPYRTSRRRRTDRRPVLARARGGVQLKIVLHAHAQSMSNHRCGASDCLEQIANSLHGFLLCSALSDSRSARRPRSRRRRAVAEARNGLISGEKGCHLKNDVNCQATNSTYKVGWGHF